MRIFTVAVCFFAFNQAQAVMPEGKGCSENLSCYFSEQEINEALGSGPARAQNEALLEMSRDDHFHDEADVEDGIENLIQLASADTSSMPHDRAPIWPSFVSNFKSCAPGCIPARFGTYGRRGNRSCHTTGRAVDVGAIVCGGQAHPAIRGGKFASFVGCMRGKMNTLYRNGRHVTKGHHDHAHFSNGCYVSGRNTY